MAYSNNADKIKLNLNSNVGIRSRNIPSDVLTIQKLLNLYKASYEEKLSLKEDGICGSQTITQISLFQKNVCGFKFPDSIVSPSGKTYQQLIKNVNLPQKAKEQSTPTPSPRGSIDIEMFISLVTKQYPNIKNTSAVRQLIQKMTADPRITYLAWIAYILATILRECHVGFEPVSEWGKGKGKEYGKPVIFTDPDTGKQYTNIYYGRGYCQITWLENYIKIGNELTLGNNLAINPDLALDKNIAYDILIHGMVNGIFTRRTISTYINGVSCDFYNARRVINGLDHASEIAENADNFYRFLKASTRN
jgi:putative chitinase